MNRDTHIVHDPHDERHYGAVQHPIYQNSLFTFASHEALEHALGALQDHYVYMRGKNPTVHQLEKRIAEAEGGDEALCFASGMAAIVAGIFTSVRSGDHIVCIQDVYAPVRSWLEQVLTRFGVETTFVDGSQTAEVVSAFRTNTVLLYLESPTSFTFRLQDIRALTNAAKSRGILTMIDNTWATPLYQQPLQLGVDIVAHSVSKYIGGHSDLLGGVLIGNKTVMSDVFQSSFLPFGGLMTPATASLAMRGLRTLPLRMERHMNSALKIAEWMRELSFVDEVCHPWLPDHPQNHLAHNQMLGASGLFSAVVNQPMPWMRKWVNGLKLFRIGISWGGYESLAVLRPTEDPRITSIRLSIGLEDPRDLIEDLQSARRHFI